MTRHALDRPTYRRLFDHPTHDRFTADEFLTEIDRHGLVHLGSITRLHGDYLLGVAVKPSRPSAASADDPNPRTS